MRRVALLLGIAIAAALAYGDGLRGGLRGELQKYQAARGWMDDSISYYAKEYGVFLPDGANSWFESRNGTVNTTETTIVNKIGTGVLSFLRLHLQKSGTLSTVDSAVGLAKLKIVIDGHAAIDNVPVQDCFGFSEVCSTASYYVSDGCTLTVPAMSVLFGKPDHCRNCGYPHSMWVCKIPMSYQDSIRVSLTAYSSAYTVTAWTGGIGYGTVELDSDYYRYQTYYSTRRLGECDINPVLEVTSDTTRTGLAGSVRVIAIGNYADGQINRPMAFTSSRANIGLNFMESAWVIFSGGCKPFITTLSAAADSGASAIYVDTAGLGSLSAYSFPSGVQEGALLLLRRRNPDYYRNSTLSEPSVGFPTLAADSIRNTSAKLRDAYPAGSLVFGSIYKSPYSRTNCTVYPGWEEFWEHGGYYQGPLAAMYFGLPKINYRPNYGLHPTATNPVSWYRIYDPPLVCSTSGGSARGLYIYQTQNEYTPTTPPYMTSRTILHTYIQGSAGYDPQLPTYTYAAIADTVFFTSLQDGYSLIRATTWKNAVGCSASAAIHDPVDLKDNGTILVGGIDEGDSFAYYPAFFTFPVSDSLLDFDPSLVDSVKLSVNCLTVGTGTNDSLAVLVPHLSHAGDTLQIDDAADCMQWRNFRMWKSPSDTTYAGMVALAEGPNTINMSASAVPYLFQFENGKWYLHLMLVSWDGYKLTDPAESVALTELASADTTAALRPYAVIYRNVNPDSGLCIWSSGDSCAVISKSVCDGKSGWWRYGITDTSNCPEPSAEVDTGRCCYDDGGSCVDTTEAACTTLGGVWDAEYLCATDPCTTKTNLAQRVLFTGDTRIYEHDSRNARNQGAIDSLSCGWTIIAGDTNEAYVLLYPDFSWAQLLTDTVVTLTSAVCSLYMFAGVSDIAQICSIHTINCDWEEGTGAAGIYDWLGACDTSRGDGIGVNGTTIGNDSAWCAPPFTSTGLDTIFVSTTVPTWRVFTGLKDYLQGFIDTPITSYGFAIRPKPPRAISSGTNRLGVFRSRDNATYYPRIWVEYEITVYHFTPNPTTP